MLSNPNPVRCLVLPHPVIMTMQVLVCLFCDAITACISYMRRNTLLDNASEYVALVERMNQAWNQEIIINCLALKENAPLVFVVLLVSNTMLIPLRVLCAHDVARLAAVKPV